jgi:hypothetical protein
MAADFTERRSLRDFPTDSAALTDAVASLQARGAIWLSAHFRSTHIIVEGWRARPTGPRASAAVKTESLAKSAHAPNSTG